MDIGALRQCLITVAFVIGMAGNVAALWILYKSAKSRNPKHVLMLRCLAVNDLVAQVGMLLLMNVSKYAVIPVYWRCALYVMLRAFGLGSGCVALVMAIERWLALTRPFLYQQYVTKQVLKQVIFFMWSLAVLLTYSPLFGFGLFYEDGKCRRYREATNPTDIIYAYMFLAFGTGMCVCIVCCNTTVFCTLAHLGKQKKKVLVRRISRSIINNPNSNAFATPEELAFAKLMAFLCIVFVLCWMPQMISIPLGQFIPATTFYLVFSRIADVLMCVYFTLDPYVYVVHQYLEKRKFRIPFQRHRTISGTAPVTPNNTPTSELLGPPTFPIPPTIPEV